MLYMDSTHRWISSDERRNNLLTLITNILTQRLSKLEEHTMKIGDSLNATVLLMTKMQKSLNLLENDVHDNLTAGDYLEEKIEKITEQMLLITNALRAVALKQAET